MSTLGLGITQAAGFLIQVFPPAWITLYFFRGQYRYPFHRVKWSLAAVLAAGTLLFAAGTLASHFLVEDKTYLMANLISIPCLALCLGYFVWVTLADLAKKLFVFLLMLNYACLVLSLSNIVLGRIWVNYERTLGQLPYYPIDILVMGVFTCCLLPVFSHFVFGKRMQKIWNMEGRGWNALLIVQAVYFVLASVVALFTDILIEEEQGLILLSVLFFSELVLYGIAFQLLELVEEKHRTELENEKNRQTLRLQEQQYENMQESMRLTRKQRHDLEHHFALLSVWSQKEENLPKIREYLEEYLEESRGKEERFCENEAVNAILNYYARLAEEEGIRLETQMDLPERIQVKNVHLSVLFGNALKNALEACRECQGKGMEAKIRLQAALIQHALVLRVENSCCHEVKKDRGGWRSTKRDGYGTGLSAMEDVAEFYHGSLEAGREGDRFLLKAVLYDAGET